jgi:hypothetical protein
MFADKRHLVVSHDGVIPLPKMIMIAVVPTDFPTQSEGLYGITDLQGQEFCGVNLTK